MPDDDTLLAHLVPRLTPQVEDAATDALAYILNMSEPCRAGLVDLVSDGDHRLAPVVSAKTQVSPTQTARLDLVGYDSGSTRLIIENSASTSLSPSSSEAGGEQRHEALGGLPRLSNATGSDIVKAGTSSLQALLSLNWATLLDRLETARYSSTVSDVRQLKALARVQDDVTFSPLHAEDLSTTIPAAHARLQPHRQ